MIRIFIGKDDVENIAYHTLCNSIIEKSSVPVCITPVYLKNFEGFFDRPRDSKQSNAFSFSRFLVPYLCDYVGYGLWMDCDMLLRCDINELWEQKDRWHSVKVVKHDYIPKNDQKFLGAKQYRYEKKNWSSVMLFNCSHMHCKKLTPEYVKSATGLDLHQFKWTTEDRIGELAKEWNWLVGEYPYNPDAKVIHFTIGGPYFYEYWGCDYADEWYFEHRKAMNCKQL